MQKQSVKVGRGDAKSDAKGVKAVVVLSGGQDSATCLALAVRKYGSDRVAAITFRYGQRHAASRGASA